MHGPDKVCRHGPTHQAQADETDFHDSAISAAQVIGLRSRTVEIVEGGLGRVMGFGSNY
jgi:hypothetical protein